MRAKIRRIAEIMCLRPRDTSTVNGECRERYWLASLNALTGHLARAAAIAAGLITVPLCREYLGTSDTGSVVNGRTTSLSSFVLGSGGGRANALQWLTAFFLVIPLQIVALRYLGVACIPWARAVAVGLGRILPGALYYRALARERQASG